MTTNLKHTPGPWKVRIADYATRILTNDEKHQIAIMIEGNGISYFPTDENASLIAAAPDLLAACKESENMIRALLADSLIASEIHKRLNEAINKAEGKLV